MNLYKNLVIRAPNWIGDAVMATPALLQIRTLFPDSTITVIATDAIAELLKEEPYVDRFFCTHPKLESKKSQYQRIIQFLRNEQFDLGILLTRSFSSAWQFWRGGVSNRVGFIDHFRRLLLTIPLQLPSLKEHDTITYQRLLLPFGGQASPAPLKLHTTKAEKDHARTLLKSSGHPQENKILIINPGAAYGSAKCWPKEYFRETIQELTQSGTITCVCIGDTKSSLLVEEIVAGIPHTINLCNKTTIRELMALLSIADGLLTNDSGPMHIGAALNTPLVALFGSTDMTRTGPIGNGRVLYKKAPCSPCFRRTCNKDFRCMYDISPKIVVEAIGEILS
jgi:heptosyltransferase II